jgi:hypothetical protein
MKKKFTHPDAGKKGLAGIWEISGLLWANRSPDFDKGIPTGYSSPVVKSPAIGSTRGGRIRRMPALDPHQLIPVIQTRISIATI